MDFVFKEEFDKVEEVLRTKLVDRTNSHLRRVVRDYRSYIAGHTMPDLDVHSILAPLVSVLNLAEDLKYKEEDLDIE